MAERQDSNKKAYYSSLAASPEAAETDSASRSTPNTVESSSDDLKPKGVKQHLWEKFQSLQQRKETQKLIAANDKNRAREKPAGKSRKRKNEERVDDAGPSTKVQIGWEDVKPFLGINNHLKEVEKGRHAPKTKLEEKIDEAINLGDLETAEKLSDHLSNREFGTKIAEAFDAKRYAEKKQREDTVAKERAQKKLKWGFDHKERWETKGNM
ncbi:protein FAM204A-like [Lineus longissimus]|uniref:protein FAM204A-like n=1 Tax=Lineus longissimus TaxID=88925 RepID=UPI002B4E4787